jgi:hypothetical protein
MFEHRSKPLLSMSAFVHRIVLYASASTGLVCFSLFAGMTGYHIFENFSWIDSFVNAAMLMGGMGPVNDLHTEAGKIFAGLYAMYCGLVFIFAVGLIAAPIFHRFLHKFHLEMNNKD